MSASPRGKQLKVDQPNVAEVPGVGPNPENGALPKRVIAIGKNPSIKSVPVGEMRTDHHRKNKSSDGAM